MKNIYFSFLFLFAVIPAIAYENIRVNEFLVDPQPQQVEIINTGSTSADLGNWIIDDNGGSLGHFSIPEGTIIGPNSCLVFSKDFNLNKSSSDSVRLIDNEMSVIDSFVYKSSSGSGISYFRLPDGGNDWATGSATLGLYNSTGTSCLASPTPTLPPASNTPTQTPTPLYVTDIPVPRISYGNIFLSEVLIDPDTKSEEWVEIYNGNDFPVTLTEWYIDDIESGGSALRKFSLEIPGKNYRAITFSASIFNNSGDSVRLLDFDKKEKDSFEYSGSSPGQSYGRSDFPDGDFCLQAPSFEKQNNPCFIQKTEALTVGRISTPTATSPGTNLTLGRTLPIKNKQIIPIATSISTTEDPGRILGISSDRESGNDYLIIRHLTVVSLSYSLLTLASVLFKMTCIYGKGLKLFASFFHSP